jgi:SAM-dependent methyltransferase
VPFGIDISEDMAEAARRRVPQATITVEDAQTADLASRGPYDLVVSRFGVMFFDQPAVAFANIRRAVASSARLVFACWRTIAENPMFSLGTSVLTAQLSPKVDDDPRAPGPAAFADPAYLQDLLVEGGWADHTITPLDVELDYGRDGSDGVEERLAVILSTSTGRLAERQLRAERGADGWSALLGEVRAALRQHVVGDRLRHPAAVWLVQAASA